jgi:threonine/homoserine/homoserine lactone efflux protein
LNIVTELWGQSSLMPFFLAGVALVATPGPATLTIAATSAAFGPRQGVRVVIGLITSMTLIAALTAGGIAALVLSVPGVVPVGSLFAAAYLLYLAYRIATAPVLRDDMNLSQAPSYRHGFLLNFVNPKAYAAAAGLFGGFVLVDHDPLFDALVKGLLMIFMLVLSDIAWIAAGRLLAGAFRDPRANRIINLLFALALLCSVALGAIA